MIFLKKAILPFWVVFLFFPVQASPGEAPSAYSESYVILLKGTVAGTETVMEKTDANGELLTTSQHELLVTDGLETKRMAFSTRMAQSGKTGIPTSYSYWYTSGGTGDSYEVTIRDARITRVLNRGGRTSEITVPLEPNMVFLDFNVYHQYDYLVRRYDSKKGGRQTFADFLPVIGNDIPVALTHVGEETLNVSGGAVKTRHFRVEFVGIWSGALWVDAAGRLVRLVIPNQDLEVIRKDLRPDFR